jgi:acetyl-CoA acetyltransferase
MAGLPTSVPGLAIDRMCAGAMTAVNTTAGGIAFGAYDVVIAGGVEHVGHHPMGRWSDDGSLPRRGQRAGTVIVGRDSTGIGTFA